MTAFAEAARKAGIAPFEIERVLDAPRDLVWEVFTDAEHLKNWWSPKGHGIVQTTVDLRPGGMFHYGLTTPNGDPYWGRFIYREIEPPERLVYVVSFSNEYGGITRHFAQDVWPQEILSETSFEALGEKTRIAIRWIPINASPDDIAAFEAGRKGMTGGFTGTLNQLEAYLGDLAGQG